MNLVRKTKTGNVSTFNDFLNNMNLTIDLCKKYGRCHLVFDMYSDEPAVKDMESERRAEGTPIVLHQIEKTTPFPKDQKRYWPSKENKLKLEKLIYTHQRQAPPSPHPIVIGNLEKDDEE